MNTFKKVGILLLALVFCLTSVMPAYAATDTSEQETQEGVKIFAADFEEDNPFSKVIRSLHIVEVVDCADNSGHGQVVEFKRVIDADDEATSKKSFYMEYAGVGAEASSVVYEFDVKLLDGANTDFRLWLLDTDKKNYYPVRIKGGMLGGSIGGSSFTDMVTLNDNIWYTIAAVCNYSDKTLHIYVNGEEVEAIDGSALNVNGVNSVSGATTAANVQTLRLLSKEGDTLIDHFQIDNVRVYQGTKPYEGELIVPEKGDIVIDPSQSIFNIEKLDTSAFPGMLEGYISLHTRNGMVYKDGVKTKLATMPLETENGYLVVAEEICNALDIDYSADGNAVTINGKTAEVTEKDGKLWIDAQYFFGEMLGKTVAVDTAAKSDGMMIAGDTEFAFPSAELFQIGSVNNLRSELQNLNDYLFFDRPTDTQILEAYNASELKEVHPRIMATADDFARLREEVKTDLYKKAWYEQLLTLADYLVEENTEPVKYELRDGVRLLFVARDVLCNMHTLGMAYQLTGEQKYADRAWVDLKAVSEFKDWYAIPLDPAEFSAAVAIGYDWMYEAFTTQQREMIEKAMYENAYRVACDEYMGNNALLQRTVVSYNQCVVINSGFALGALAFMDVYPEVSSYIVSNAVRAADVTFTEYGPDGAWMEGPNYWDYTTQYASKLMSSLETIFGTCFSLDLCEGLSDTADYMLNVQSDQGVFNYNDCGEKVLYAPEMLYLSDKYEKPEVTSAVLELTDGKIMGAECKEEDIVLALLWYDTSIEANTASMPPLDSAYYSEGIAAFRDQWSSEATAFVGIHGGYNRIIHGQLDAGTFVYDYAGFRWVKELGKTPYDTEVTGSYGTEGGRWRLYRSKAEAHNTIVIVNEDTSPTGTDQVVDARATLTEVKSGVKGSIAVMDMTSVYAQGATKAIRGFFFTDDRTSLVVRDEISLLKDASTVYSFLQTDAEVELAADGQSAILTQNGVQIKLEFVTDGKGTVALGYGPSTRALLGTTSPIEAEVSDDEDKYDVENADVNRIYVKLEDAAGEVAITIKLTPVGVSSTPVTDYNKSISSWTVPEGEIAAKPEVQSVITDGHEINFDSGKQATFLSPAGKYSSVPETVVTVDESKFTYQVTNAASTNGGTTTIVVSDKINPNVFTTYSINFVEIPEPKEFEGMTSIQVVNVEASDEPQADRGYNRWCVLDNDTSSRWTSLGSGNWICFELEEMTTIDNMMAVFLSSTTRQAYFSVYASTDGENWDEIWNGKSNITGETGEYQQFELGGVTAKYIRLDCNGNTAQGMLDGWNSIGEIVFTKNGETADNVTFGYTAGISATDSAVKVDDIVYIPVAVSHASETSFNACEITVTYDSAVLSFDSEESALDTAVAENAVSEGIGTLTLADYGEAKACGTSVYTLAFTALEAADNSAVTITGAGFTNIVDAVKKDLTEATLSPASVSLTVSEKSLAVDLNNTLFKGEASVDYGADYTFSLADDGAYYDYSEITATMGGTTVEVLDNNDGTYTIEKVTGALVITATRTAKSYSVIIEGTGAEDVKAGDGTTVAKTTATYGQPYTFTTPVNWAEYSYEVAITIAGNTYENATSVSGEEKVTYTIPGEDITEDIVIIVTKTKLTADEVSVEIPSGVNATGEEKATIGEAYTLTLTQEAGYEYTVTASMVNSDTVTLTEEIDGAGNKTYTIANVTGAIVFNITKVVDTSGITVSQYITLDGSIIWLVENTTEVAEGKVPIYNGAEMFRSSKYGVDTDSDGNNDGAYCYLVVSGESADNVLAAAREGLDIAGLTGSVAEVAYDNDVNETGRVDASDAQLVWNMYNAQYSDFTADVTVAKFLEADVNGDKTVNTTDAAAIISAILK